jgi:molybdopterin-guanine dinucleotide biosynthesis protein
MAVNPFIWTRPLDDPSRIVGMDGFAREVALILKGQTNVAIFGPRDTGKTTFTTLLAHELGARHGPDAPPHVVLRINLQRVFSIPAFIGAVHDALMAHPDRSVKKQARKQLETLEKEIGFDIKIIKGAVKRAGVTPEQDEEALHAQLASLAGLGDHVVVIFDEFQRLNQCPGNPLSIIRSALMSGTANHVSLLLTGSIRAALKMMLEHSDEPIFGEALQMQLPEIPRSEFYEYLEFQFEATGKPATDEALEHLLNLTRSHPKRTQQLAWSAWQRAGRRKRVDLEIVQEAYAEMLNGPDVSEFEVTLDVLANGGEAEANEHRALFLIADRGGEKLTSRHLVGLYGFTSHARIPDAVDRLKRRGLIEDRAGTPEIVDPLLVDWLRRQSPLALRRSDIENGSPGGEAP